jgi:hypothetical protein
LTIRPDPIGAPSRCRRRSARRARAIQFTFENAARLHTALNPDFFKGTVVEGAVAKLK